eukprot:5350796-Pleurochrysis_carterae.AAC.2
MEKCDRRWRYAEDVWRAVQRLMPLRRAAASRAVETDRRRTAAQWPLPTSRHLSTERAVRRSARPM